MRNPKMRRDAGLRWWVSAALSVTLLASAPAAHAQLPLEDDAPRVFSIQERPYRLGHEFDLGLGVLPLDAFYVGAVLGFGYTYHFSDFWAWEIVNLNYSFNRDTDLREDLRIDFGLEPAQADDRIRLFGSSGLVVKPLFGKIAVLNDSVVYGETFFTLGAGPHLITNQDQSDDWVAAVNVGLGLRFWTTESLSVRFALRDYLVFKESVPENSLMLMLSASFNYPHSDSPGDSP